MIQKGKPALILAPMEGVTDRPMRALMTDHKAFTHCVAEFLRISGTIPPEYVFERHVPELKNNSKTPTGVPVLFQLLGGDAEKLAQSALVAANLGAIGIDLNFGCPAATVNRHDGGATLLKSPDRIFQIISAVRSAVPSSIPVSAKFRLGWDTITPIYKIAEIAVEAGASWITIHGRTKIAGYNPPAYWGPIGDLNRTLPIPVIANGDIWTLDDFKRCRDETGCEHFMLGRGAIANPHLPFLVAKELGLPSEDFSEFPDFERWKVYFSRLIDLSLPTIENPNYALRRVKQWLKTANARVPTPFYDQVKVLQTLDEFRTLL